MVMADFNPNNNQIYLKWILGVIFSGVEKRYFFFRSVSEKYLFRFCKIIFCMYKSRPKHTKKKMTIIFFIYFGTHNNNIHTIYKKNQCFCFYLFYVVVYLLLLAKQQQQKWIFRT
jgi:hypothetical protein